MSLKSSKQYSLSITFFAVLFSLLFSCSQEGNVIKTNELISVQDTCSGNTNHTYEVYLPGNAKACVQLPLIVILDPHGSGKTAIKKFIPAADQYKCMLAASNLIKNNFGNYSTEINSLLEDVRAKYPTNGKIYLAGFSGGARMALAFGQRNIVDGVIACGALATTNQIITIRAPVYVLTGMQDFNFIETAQYFFRPENTPGNLLIELSEEMHEWPSEQDLSNGIAYLLIHDNQLNRKCIDAKKIHAELTDMKKSQIDQLKKKGNFLSALLIAKNMTRLYKDESINPFQSLLNSIEYSEGLNKELNQLKESIRFELSVRDAYMNAFLAEDLAWWKNEISSLDQNIKQDKDHYRNLAYKRIKAFLGIMCYTITNKTLQSDDLKSAEKLLSVYQLIEPNNPDMFYFYALYYSETGQIYEAKSYLKKAIHAGFSNQELIKRIRL